MTRLFPALLAAGLLAQPIQMGRIRKDVEALSAPALAGRVPLEPGARAAADMVARAFTDAGLRPCCGGSYLQAFDLWAPSLDASKSALRYNGAALPFTGSFRRDFTVKAGAVFVGYGITAPEYGYDDYAGLDVAGKVVALLEREPQEGDAASRFLGRGLTKHANPRAKRLNAQAHGAAAVIVLPSAYSLSAPGASSRTPQRGNAGLMFDEGVKIPMLTLSADAAARLAPEYRAWQDRIDRAGSPDSRTLPGEVEIALAHRQIRTGPTWNVVGILPGASDEAVLLTSHYDHLPSRPGIVYPGANDNASGTAAVMELARAFAKGPKPRRTLVFVSFGAEEEGLLGSYFYVDHPVIPLARTKAVINLDMIGRNEAHTPQSEGRLDIARDTRKRLNIVGGAYFPELAAAVARANRGVGFTLDDKFDRESTQNVLWRCDHFPFLLAGTPALWLFGGFHPGYHEPVDTPDRIDWKKLERVVKLAYRVAAE